MARRKNHSIRFLNLVDDAKMRIEEIPCETVLRRFKKGIPMNIIDIRDFREYLGGHIQGCRHISRGILERDIDFFYPHLDQELILYCDEGYRSALAADSLLKMGYQSVFSMSGGWNGWKKMSGPISLL